MTNSLLLSIISIMAGSFITWTIYVTKKLISIDFSVKYINKNLHIVDWTKIPMKNLNEIFNKQGE